MTLPPFLFFSAWFGASVMVLNHMNQVNPDPYMDEIFHIPQAQKYCQCRFKEWDPKITTLPGLYLISIGMLSPTSKVSSHFNMLNETNDSYQNGCVSESLCSTASLRSLNLVISFLNAIILHKLSVQIHGGKHYFDESKVLLSSINMSLFPVMYFFTFLYYTDVGSTCLVLLMYCLHMEGQNWLASFIGLLAVGFRQTNIVWVAFVAIQSVGPIVIHAIHSTMVKRYQPITFSLTTKGQIWELFEGMWLILGEPWTFLKLILECLKVAGGFVMVWLLFMAFIVWNDGIVVGDRNAHTAVFHPTQVLYFCLTSLAFSFSFCLTKFRVFVYYAKRHCILLLVIAIFTFATVDSYTLAHEYLLADNRHYTFYVWRRVITGTSWTKFALVPFYMFGGFCILHSIRKTNVIFKLSFPVLVAVNLSPQLLLEFRYFILPYLFYRLQIRPQSWWKLALESLLYLMINIFTIVMYLYKPFRWDHEPESLQRFIW